MFYELINNSYETITIIKLKLNKGPKTKLVLFKTLQQYYYL